MAARTRSIRTATRRRAHVRRDEIVKPKHVGLDQDSWVIDHGTWSVLAHAFPKADIAVVQLSIHALRNVDSHFELGARLAPLRERGMLIVGSGNIVHTSGRSTGDSRTPGSTGRAQFDEGTQIVLTEKPSQAPALRNHAEYIRSAPTPDHFLPLLYLAGLAGAANRPLELLVGGYTYGSISMAAYTLDAKCRLSEALGYFPGDFHVVSWLSAEMGRGGSTWSEMVWNREPISIPSLRFPSQVRVTIRGQAKRSRWFDSRRLHLFLA